MILRSFPITDLSPLEGSLIDGWAPLAPVERVVRGSSGLGSVEELRVNMISPNEIGLAFARHPSRDDISSTSPLPRIPGDSGLAVAAPLVLLLGVILFRSAELERTQLEQRMMQVAGGLADAVDRELDRSLAMLRTLATSPALASGDFAAFYAQATAALGGRDASVFLVEPSSLQQ
jgi:hypothetical protein